MEHFQSWVNVYEVDSPSCPCRVTLERRVAISAPARQAAGTSTRARLICATTRNLPSRELIRTRAPERSLPGTSNFARSGRAPREACKPLASISSPSMATSGVPSSSVRTAPRKTSKPDERSGPAAAWLKIASQRTAPVRVTSPARSARPPDFRTSALLACGARIPDRRVGIRRTSRRK